MKRNKMLYWIVFISALIYLGTFALGLHKGAPRVISFFGINVRPVSIDVDVPESLNIYSTYYCCLYSIFWHLTPLLCAIIYAPLPLSLFISKIDFIKGLGRVLLPLRLVCFYLFLEYSFEFVFPFSNDFLTASMCFVAFWSFSKLFIPYLMTKPSHSKMMPSHSEVIEGLTQMSVSKAQIFKDKVERHCSNFDRDLLLLYLSWLVYCVAFAL